MDNVALKPFNLQRKDGKIVEVELYNFSNINDVQILDIKNLKFEGTPAKDIKKSDIHNAVLKDKNKLYFQNKYSKMVAGLSKKHLNKIISTVFTRDIESRHAYLKKELISNVNLIFYAAVPILKHAELKKQALFEAQIIHRFALPIKIGGLIFFAMITVKERIDNKELQIDEFSIYDLYSEAIHNKKSSGSSSTVSSRTFRSHYQMTNYSIYDLFEFVKCSITKKQQ